MRKRSGRSMSNIPVWLIAALLALVGGILLLSGLLNPAGPGNEMIDPAVISLSQKLALLSDVTGAKAEPLFDSSKASLALLRVESQIPAHVHHKSNEVLYVLSGTGKAHTGSAEYDLSPGILFIAFAKTPIELEKTGDQPLDLLIFLTPPSNEKNVTRLKPEEFSALSKNSLLPLLVNVPERMKSISIQGKAIPSTTLSNFSADGNLGLIQLPQSQKISADKVSANLLIYVLNGTANAKINSLEATLKSGDLVIVPARSKFVIESPEENQSSTELIFFSAPPWQAP
ncbi:cupin domain-containing protein [Candidatus Acetothermia bacterium]|nr:cupin domain-containing protein [Candidatus Acetothermia bacterium]MBI3643480.1 cupin domain-containing protein [Candidatus Acetothermia bacterium]